MPVPEVTNLRIDGVEQCLKDLKRVSYDISKRVERRREHDALRARAQRSYESYLISRSRGIRSAIEPARRCWQRAEKAYLLTCHHPQEAASGEPETPEAAQEDWLGILVGDIEDVRGWARQRFRQLDEQTQLLRAATDRNTEMLTELLKELTGMTRSATAVEQEPQEAPQQEQPQ